MLIYIDISREIFGCSSYGRQGISCIKTVQRVILIFFVNSDESSDADDMKSSASNNSEQKKIQIRKNTNKKPVRENAILRLNKDTFEFESDTDV